MALFKTFRMQNGDMLIISPRFFRKVRFRKMQFLKDGVQTVGLFCVKYFIDPVGKLLFHKEKSILVTGTAPFPPFCSFGRGYNSVIIAMI